MYPLFYESANEYIDACTDKAAQIAAYNAIIAALQRQALVMASTGSPIHDYSLNDGQTMIRTTYKSFTEITNAIQMFLKLRNMVINQGDRVTSGVDGGNLIGNRYNLY